MDTLALSDLQFILESLQYTRLKFEDYQQYPSYEYKQKRIAEVNEVIGKIQGLLKEKK